MPFSQTAQADEYRYNLLNDACGDSELTTLAHLVRGIAKTNFDEIDGRLRCSGPFL